MSHINSGSVRSVVLAAAAMLAAVIVGGCAGLPPGGDPPTVTIADFWVGNASLLEQEINLKLRIQNPNPYEFTVEGMAFDLEINNEPFAKGVGNQPVTVPRFGSGFMLVEAVSTLGGLLRQFGRLVQGDKRAFKYHITGTLTLAGGRRVPFERRGEFDFPGMTPRP